MLRFLPGTSEELAEAAAERRLQDGANAFRRECASRVLDELEDRDHRAQHDGIVMDGLGHHLHVREEELRAEGSMTFGRRPDEVRARREAPHRFEETCLLGEESFREAG
jgi:hypothetical protein